MMHLTKKTFELLFAAALMYALSFCLVPAAYADESSLDIWCSCSGIHVGWERSASCDGYLVQRGVNGSDPVDYKTFSASTTSFKDASVTQKKRYDYFITPFKNLSDGGVELGDIQAVGVTFKGVKGTCGKSAYWFRNYDDGTVVVSGKGAMKNYKMLGNPPWGNNKLDITRVVIEDGITSIGNNAFLGCYALDKILIGKNVKTIGTNAFFYCLTLKSVTIPKNVRTIKGSAFGGCERLKTVNLSKGLKTIGPAAFNSCKKVKSITIPSTVKSIGKEAFYYCKKLRTVRFEGSAPKFSSEVFACDKLTIVYTSGKKNWAKVKKTLKSTNASIRWKRVKA